MAIKQKTKSLKARGSDLSDTFQQLRVLSNKDTIQVDIPTFNSRIIDAGWDKGMTPDRVEIFQINIGKLCNQTCAHCHVDAGPDKKEENMSRATLETCLAIIEQHKIPSVDITGGAPEMNAHFRWFVESCSAIGVKVMVRCNLTILKANPKYHDLPEFYKKNKVQVISSLPYFSKNRTDSQRGDGVFEDSIAALQSLNAVGYGIEGTGLILDLVHNPSGAYLPGPQEELQAEFKRQLDRKFGIRFNSLYAITNLPVSRFLDYLIETENYVSYMEELSNAYNPATLDGLMCKNTLSISWDGYIHDCDFNQMLDLKSAVAGTHINDFDMEQLMNRTIVTNQHCYGCTAGAGSSCGGEIT